MSAPFQNIMLVTNEPSDSNGAEQTVLQLAKLNSASVLLVDSVTTPFAASRSPKLSSDCIFEMAINAKQEYLNELQSQFVNQGVITSSQVLVGPRTSSELISTVVEQECDLVVRYLKGQSSRAGGRYGGTAENLMRACPVPVLFTEAAITNPRVVACINLEHGPEENQAILENARRLVGSPEQLSVLACWEFSGREFLFDYADEGLNEQSKEEAAVIYHKLFDRFQDEYDIEDLNDSVFLMNESPISAIPRFCTENAIDIAVMCSSSLNHPLGRKLGSTIERTIGTLPCALLTVKPIGFTALGLKPVASVEAI